MSEDEKGYQGENHQGEERHAPYPVSRLAPAIKLVDLAREIEQADAQVNHRVSAKLRVIADQIRSLQAQARNILDEASRDKVLHQAQCQFKRIPGRIYHLYEKGEGNYFSMLSPQEWAGSPPHRFIGSYRLEADMSWTPVEELGRPDPSGDLVKRLLDQSDI